MISKPVLGIQVQKRRATEIDDLGAACRKRYASGTRVDQPVDVLEVLEEFDGLEFTLPDGRPVVVKLAVENNLPSHVLGHTTYNKEQGRIFIAFSDSTYAAMKSDGWARFTAPHEIGHVKLHIRELVRLTALPHDVVALARMNPAHSYYDDSEYQANRFAAAFLAPDDGLKILDREGRLDPENVMHTFGLSRTAATYRIRNYRKALTASVPTSWRRVHCPRHAGHYRGGRSK